MPSSMMRMLSSVLRERSVSSMRRMKRPPCLRAKSQQNRAVRTPPMCSRPVGDGAKRVTTWRDMDGPRIQTSSVPQACGLRPRDDEKRTVFFALLDIELQPNLNRGIAAEEAAVQHHGDFDHAAQRQVLGRRAVGGGTGFLRGLPVLLEQFTGGDFLHF